MDCEKNANQQGKCISDWDRMIAGKLYNSASKDIEQQHTRGLVGCDEFNRIPVSHCLGNLHEERNSALHT